jgi:ATP-dependent DNA helicase RecG
VTQPSAPVSDTIEGRTLRSLDALDIDTLRTLRPKKAEALRAFGVSTILDLVTTFPRRHIDRTRRAEVADLAVGDEAVVLAQVERSALVPGRRGRARVELKVADESGTMKVVFFNQGWRAKQLPAGSMALFSGKLSDYRGQRQMVNPLVDLIVGVDDESAAHRRRTLRVVPIYPASAKAGLTSWEIGTWVAEALERTKRFVDPLDLQWRTALSLVERTTAMWGYHLPDSMSDLAPARKRLVFDELFRLQLALVLRRRALEADARAIRHQVSPLEITRASERRRRPAGERQLSEAAPTLLEAFLEALPFELTDAQRRALAVIAADLAGPLPMHRLLQGDVGSGKTVVALGALLAGVQGGHQGALMVPTEVLAEQHYLSVREMLGTLSRPDPARLDGRRPLTVRLLTSRTSAKDRKFLHEGLRSGEIDIVVGTHALLTDEVRFASLGVVVIDEQHRFGVEQRATLREKGRGEEEEGADPDLLVMTATPIPRTAAMVVFGDLDMTVLDELPPGRSPIQTTWVRELSDEEAAWERVRQEAGSGHRAYIVCPLVEGSERLEARSATEEFDRLQREVLPGLDLGLLHGQMPSAEKEATMAAFREGRIQVLVATTVIEVGVDVPEATVMVIEDASRFGIAQLHQLRGRVGRSGLPSWCYLLGPEASVDAQKRLLALEGTNDGFVLAEVDLELRGAGTILGARQKGRSDLQLASLRDDEELLHRAREVAEEITAEDPRLADHPLLADEMRLFLDEEEAAFLFRS